MGQKVNPHGLRVGVIMIGIPAGLLVITLSAISWSRTITCVNS